MCIGWLFFLNRVKMHGDDNIKFKKLRGVFILSCPLKMETETDWK
jgi:hypothetical protein